MGTKPQLSEVIADAIGGELANVHTSIPGKVVSYDAPTQTASVRLGVKFSRRGPDGERIPYEAAPLADVPILWGVGGGGAYSDTWPLERGDEVWILFAERSVDEWIMEGNDVAVPDSVRRFNLSDAVAIPAASSRKTPLPADAVANARVIRADEIRLGGAAAFDYVALASLVRAELDLLWSAMSSHTHTVPTVASPITPTTAPIGIVPSYAPVGSMKVKAE